MGALPSRETQERGLYSHRHGRNRRNEIVLIPLTSTFFPSAECELFKHLFKARYRRTTKYYFRALRSTECSTESDYFCTTSAVNEPELFAQYVQERENKLAQAKTDWNMTTNNSSSNTKSKVNCKNDHTNTKCTQDDATDVDYHYHSFADTPEGLYQVLIRDNDLCVYNTDEELRKAYLHQTREQRTELERMTRHCQQYCSDDNIKDVNGHLCNNFVQQSKKEEETDCNAYEKQDDSSFAHSNEHNKFQFLEECIENVTFDAFMTGYMAAQLYHKGKTHHTHYAKQEQKEQQQLENNKEASNTCNHVSEKYNECNNSENDKFNKVNEQSAVITASNSKNGNFVQKCNYCNHHIAYGEYHFPKQELQQEENHQEEYYGVNKGEKKAEDATMDVHVNNTVNHESKYDINTTTNDTVLMCNESNDKSTTLCVNTEARSNETHTTNNKMASNNIICESNTLRSPMQQSAYYSEEQQHKQKTNHECSHHEYSVNDSNNCKNKVYKKEVLKRVTSPNAYNIRPIPCAIASRYDATKPPPTDDPLYVQFDGFYVKIMGMFGLFPSTMGCRYQTCTTDEYKCSGGSASADIHSNKNYNNNCNGVNNINKNDAGAYYAAQMNTKSCNVQNHQHHRQHLPRKEGNANCGDIDSDCDDDEDNNNNTLEEEHYISQHVLKATMFIDKDVGDQILGNMVMLATHMYVRQCLEAQIKPEYIPMMPVVLRSPMSNIPMLQFLREFRVRLRTLIEAGTARSGELPYYVGMSGFHPADIALPHDPCKQKEELIRYLFEEDVPDISDYDDLFDARLSNVPTNTTKKQNESAAATTPSVIMNSKSINNNIDASTITTNKYNNGTKVSVNGNNNSAQNANVQISASDQTTSPMYMNNHFLAVHNLSNNFTPLPVNSTTQDNSFLSTLHSPTWPAQISPPTSSTIIQNVTKGVGMMPSLFP